MKTGTTKLCYRQMRISFGRVFHGLSTIAITLRYGGKSYKLVTFSIGACNSLRVFTESIDASPTGKNVQQDLKATLSDVKRNLKFSSLNVPEAL